MTALVVDTELKPGHVYSVRIPPGCTVLDLQQPLRDLAERTGAGLVVFEDGATVSEIEGQAVELLTAEVKRLRALVAAADEYGDRHVIDLREDSWTIAHPLSCRATGLFACLLNSAATDLAGPPRIGKFAVHVEDGRLVLGERIDETQREAGLDDGIEVETDPEAYT